MGVIGISYTAEAGQVYNIVFDNFGDSAMPRTYSGAVDFSLSANGTSILSGPVYRQKYQWVISTIMSKNDALNVDQLFRSWDTDRSQGLSAACGLSDTTWGPQVDTSVVFVTPPSFTRLSPILTLVSLGLSEV